MKGNEIRGKRVPSFPSNNESAMYQNFASIGLTTNGYTAPTNPLIISEMNLAASNAPGLPGTHGLVAMLRRRLFRCSILGVAGKSSIIAALFPPLEPPFLIRHPKVCDEFCNRRRYLLL